MKRVYVAGPMHKGWFGDHMRGAIDAADELMEANLAPFLPQLFLPQLCFFWQLMGAGWSYESWMKYDRVWLLQCDILLRLPGESSGADREVEWAKDALIPVYFDVPTLIGEECGPR